MKKLNKTQEKILKEAKKFVLSKDNIFKDEWYDTERGFVKYVLQDFLSSIGIHATIEELEDDVS